MLLIEKIISNNKVKYRMSYNNEQSKSSRFDRLMYSDPEHVVFSYSP